MIPLQNMKKRLLTSFFVMLMQLEYPTSAASFVCVCMLLLQHHLCYVLMPFFNVFYYGPSLQHFQV